MRAPFLALVVGVMTIGLAGEAGFAQISRLYVTNNLNNGGWCIDTFRNQTFDFAFNTATALSSVSEPAIAVWGDVRTAPLQTAGLGHQYDLSGNYLNQSYAASIDLSPDGTTDGQYNYCIPRGGNGGVYRFDRSWQNATPLFTSPNTRGFSYGITFDPVDQTLWVLTSEQDPISGARTFWVEQFDRSGVWMTASQVVSNDPFFFPEHSGLALDPADRTLWIINQSYLLQVGRNGVALSPVLNPYPFLYVNPPGGEFNLLPEPSSGIFVAALCLGAIRRRRRRKP